MHTQTKKETSKQTKIHLIIPRTCLADPQTNPKKKIPRNRGGLRVEEGQGGEKEMKNKVHEEEEEKEEAC